MRRARYPILPLFKKRGVNKLALLLVFLFFGVPILFFYNPKSSLAQCLVENDFDLDCVTDALDNCPAVYNPGQEDADGDGIGDACDVDIDIKPGSDPNCIKVSTKGSIPVAILATEDLDVTTIDIELIELSHSGVDPVRSSENKDVSGDGRPDLVLHYKTQDLANAGLLEDGRILVITGELFDGRQIIGEDQIFLAGGPNCFD